MAMPASRLLRFVASAWTSDEALLVLLRDSGLVKPDASNDELMAGFRKVREEYTALPEGPHFGSREGSVVGFLQRYLSDKGREWAVPPWAERQRPWWRFW
jgi:hypothetical protein